MSEERKCFFHGVYVGNFCEKCLKDINDSDKKVKRNLSKKPKESFGSFTKITPTKINGFFQGEVYFKEDIEGLVIELQNRNREDEIKLSGISINNVYVISSEKLEGRIEGREEALVLFGMKEKQTGEK